MRRLLVSWLLAPLLAAPAMAQQNPEGLAKPGTARVRDRFEPLPTGEVEITGGLLGTRVEASVKARLLAVNEDDLLDTFERRLAPHQDWAGEHVGKFLHAATLAWASPGDADTKAKLREKIDRVAGRLIKTQEADGYLGGYRPDRRWRSWDVWVHKYALLGLLTYHQYTKSPEALAACRRVGDLLINVFGRGPDKKVISLTGTHTGLATTTIIEPMVLLYRATGDRRYLEFAQYVVASYDAPGGPQILASLEKYRNVRQVANAKSYEMLSNFTGLLELYRARGDKRLLDDVLIAWQDIVDKRLYVTGTASTREHWQDDHVLPNEMRHNVGETCVTVTWEQLNLQLLRLTGEVRFAEQAERTILNHLLGAQKPTGEAWAYYTSLQGRKPYSAGTTCCLSSGPRGLALAPSIAYMKSPDGGLVINLLTNSKATTALRSGRVAVEQRTSYPLEGKVEIAVSPARDGQRFPVRVRVPAWTRGATLSVAGGPAAPAKPGEYAVVDRRWKTGDVLTLEVDPTPRLVEGTHGNADRAVAMYGPLVLAADAVHNPELPTVRQAAFAADKDAFKLVPAPDRSRHGEPVWKTDGRIGGKASPLYLTPFAAAGGDGKSAYSVWLARAGVEPPAFVPITKWWFKREARGEAAAAEVSAATLDPARAGWTQAATGDDTFKGQRGFGWFRATLEARPHRTIRFHGIDDSGSVFLNGVKLHAGARSRQTFEVNLEKAWRKDRPNVLTVLIENTGGRGGIVDEVELVDPY